MARKTRDEYRWASDAIKALRARYGESQPEFARRLNMGPDAVVKWEQGAGAGGCCALLLDRVKQDIDRVRPEQP